MNKTNYSINAKTALLLKQLICAVRVLMAITVILVICAQPCRAARVHSHKYRVTSVSCKTGMQTLSCSCGRSKKIRCKKGHDFKTSRDGLYSIKKCKRCGKVAKKYLSKDIPTYWDSTIAKALKTAKARSSLPGYVYLTDPHWNKNAQNSPAIVNYVAKQMGYNAVCGGDVVTGCHENKQDAENEITDFYSKINVPVLSVQGNHDNNRNDNPNQSAYLSQSELNQLVYSHAPPGMHLSNGGDSGYLDDKAHRVRYITFYYDETTPVSVDVIDSINQRVSELDGRWSVVLFSHAYWHYSKPGGEPYPKPEAKQLAAKLLNIQAHSDATIVLWHVGHIHRDKGEVLSDSNGNQILVVASNCDAYQRSACWGGLQMTKGTSMEQVIEIVQIDKDNGKVYLTRIGAGESRSFPSK